MMNNVLWIPKNSIELQLRLCVEAHCCSVGHKAYEATLSEIKDYMAWIAMPKNVKVFVQNCLRCVATISRDKLPRPLGTQLHETKPNEVLYFDFLYIKRREVSVLATSQG
jgi:Integrase zinc binding domain